MTRDPLAPQPGDDALLQAVLADESKLRNEVILLDVMSVLKPDARHIDPKADMDLAQKILNKYARHVSNTAPLTRMIAEGSAAYRTRIAELEQENRQLTERLREAEAELVRGQGALVRVVEPVRNAVTNANDSTNVSVVCEVAAWRLFIDWCDRPIGTAGRALLDELADVRSKLKKSEAENAELKGIVAPPEVAVHRQEIQELISELAEPPAKKRKG